MPNENEPISGSTAEAGAIHTLLATVNASQPFGPTFFLSHLRGLVRDHCPSPGELPRVDVHLHDGELLHVCHVVGLAPLFVAIAVAEPSHPTSMRLEMIPYDTIRRVTLSSSGREREGVGFEVDRRPAIIAQPAASAESLLSIASQPAGDQSGSS